MRRVGSISLAAAALALPIMLAPEAQAASKIDVVIEDTRTFDPENQVELSEVETNIPGCETGVTVDERVNVAFTPNNGIFLGIRDFQCDSGSGGLVIRLTAQFSYEGEGSSGTWSVVDSYGDLEGLHGAGTLTGTSTPDGIIDVYTGTLTWH